MKKKKFPFILALKFEYLPISLYRALLFKDQYSLKMAKTNRALLGIIIHVLPTCLIYLVTYTGKFTCCGTQKNIKGENTGNLNLSSR